MGYSNAEKNQIATKSKKTAPTMGGGSYSLFTQN